MGHNGHNGKTPKQILMDKIVEKSPEFAPTRRQQRVRDRAVQLWHDLTGKPDAERDGLPRQFSVGAFIRHAGADFRPKLGLKEWNEWDGIPGFTAWFMSAFPDLERATMTDLRILEGAYLQGVMRQVQKGEPSGLRLYGQMRRESRAGSKMARVTDQARQDLDDFLSASDGSPWLSDTPEA